MEKQALHDVLCTLLGPFPKEEGDHCYYQPPTNTEMYYPCFVYKLTNNLDQFADNIHYARSKRYSVTYITEDPDDDPSNKMDQIPYCVLDRPYDVDGLTHFVYSLYWDGPRIKDDQDIEK